MAFKSNLGFKMQIFSEDMAQKEAKSCPSGLSIGFRREWLRITFPKHPVLAFTDTWRYHEPAMWHLGKSGFNFLAKVSVCMQRASISVLLCKPVLCFCGETSMQCSGRLWGKKRQDSGYQWSSTIWQYGIMVKTIAHNCYEYIFVKDMCMCVDPYPLGQDAQGQVVQHQGLPPKVAQSCAPKRKPYETANAEDERTWTRAPTCVKGYMWLTLTLYHWCTLYITVLHLSPSDRSTWDQTLTATAMLQEYGCSGECSHHLIQDWQQKPAKLSRFHWNCMHLNPETKSWALASTTEISDASPRIITSDWCLIILSVWPTSNRDHDKSSRLAA